MRVLNKSKRMYVHSVLNERKQPVMLILKPGENLEVPDEIAEQWLRTGEVVKFADPGEVEALKAELEKLKKEKEEPKEKSLDELKKEADKLGITYAKNIGAAKLAQKIADAKK